MPDYEKVGVLRKQSSGRWAVCRPGREPVEIISGEPFRVEVDGECVRRAWSSTIDEATRRAAARTASTTALTDTSYAEACARRSVPASN